MNNKETLQSCFSLLSLDLHKIKHYDAQYPLPYQKHAINNILTEIYSCNPEDAQQFLFKYISDIDELIQTLPKITKVIRIQDKFTYEMKVLDPKLQSTKDAGKKLRKFFKDRLLYYKLELNTILSQIENNLDELGSDRFASAGFKLKLNMPVEEIALFFRALLETNLINPEKSVRTKLTKGELANFINANFSSESSDNIGIKSLKNALSANIDFTSTLEERFKKLYYHVKS